MEVESYHKVKLLVWFSYPILIGLAILQAVSFYLYNGRFHPNAHILEGTDNSSKDCHTSNEQVNEPEENPN